MLLYFNEVYLFQPITPTVNISTVTVGKCLQFITHLTEGEGNLQDIMAE